MKVSKVCLVGSVDSSLPLKVPVFWLELHLFLLFFLHEMINMNQLSCVLLKIVYWTELGCTISCFTCCLCKPSPCKAANQKKHRQWKVSKLLRLWSPTWSTWFMSLARFAKQDIESNMQDWSFKAFKSHAATSMKRGLQLDWTVRLTLMFMLLVAMLPHARQDVICPRKVWFVTLVKSIFAAMTKSCLTVP